MSRHRFVRSTKVTKTPKLLQLEGMFDLDPVEEIERSWDVEFDLDREWNIGVVVGPSGSGKTTFVESIDDFSGSSQLEWDNESSIVDNFDAPISETISMLSSVGFSSPPSWRQPFHTLSTGEQFRASVARAILDAKIRDNICVIDEYTSVVDRTVARVGSIAIAKQIRRNNQKFVAATCHYDVIDWLQPDWVMDMSTLKLTWRSVQRPEPIELEIYRTTYETWDLFSRHHYLDQGHSKSAIAFVGLVEGSPAVFSSAISQPSKLPTWREHRTVVLPDHQGIGIGNRMSEFVASLFLTRGYRYISVTTHPGMVAYRSRSPLWDMVRAPKASSVGSKPDRNNFDGWFGNDAWKSRATHRRSTGLFEYVGPAAPLEHLAFFAN